MIIAGGRMGAPIMSSTGVDRNRWRVVVVVVVFFFGQHWK